MSRIKRPKADPSGTPGAYRHVADQIDEQLGLWRLYNPTRGDNPDAGPYATIRADRSVNVPTWMLPETAVQRTSRRLASGSLVVCEHARAIMRPDDSVTFTDADAVLLSLEENAI